MKFLEQKFHFVVSEPVNELVVEGHAGLDEFWMRRCLCLLLKFSLMLKGGLWAGGGVDVALAGVVEPRIEIAEPCMLGDGASQWRTQEFQFGMQTYNKCNSRGK